MSAASLTAQPVAVSAVLGTGFSGPVATFASGNPQATPADFSATIAWGDGTATSTGTIATRPSGGFTVTGSHTYAAAGSFATTITVTRTGGATAVAHGTATVNPATTSSTTSTSFTTTAAGPPPGPPLVHAAFSVATLGPGGARLDASASTAGGATAARYEWTFGGPHGTDIVCPGPEPQLSLFARHPLNTTVTLAAVDAGGTVSSASHAVAVTAPAGARAGARAGGLGTIGLCTGALSRPVHPLTAARLGKGSVFTVSKGGAPPDDCTDDIVFGAADVHGCLAQIPDPHDLPGGISRLLSGLLCGAQASDFCLHDLTSAAGVAGSVAGSLAGVTAARARATAVSHGTVKQLDAVLRDIAFPSYYSWTAIRLDGVDIVPQNGNPVLIVPSADAIVGASVKLYLDHHPITPKPIPFGIYVPAQGGHLGDITLPRSVPIIGSLPFTGSISIDLHRAHAVLPNGDRCQYACAAVSVSAALPGVFSDGDGNGLSASGVLTADAVNGLVLDSLEVKVPLGGDRRDRRLNRRCALPPRRRLAARPGHLQPVRRRGRDHRHGRLRPRRLPGRLGPVGRGRRPRHRSGRPAQRLPGQTRRRDLAGSDHDHRQRGHHRRAAGARLRAAGDRRQRHHHLLAVLVRRRRRRLAALPARRHEFFHYDDSGFFHFGGSVDLHFALFELIGGIDVAVDVPQGHFQFDGNVSACLDVYGQHCLGAEAVVSDRGIGVCADLGFTHAGGGVQFPDNVLVFFDSCDIGKFRSLGFITAVRPRAPASPSPAASRSR